MSTGLFPALSQAKRSLGRLFAERTPRPKAAQPGAGRLESKGTTPLLTA